MNNQTLTVTGPVRDTGAATQITLNAQAGNLDLIGSITAANAVNLKSCRRHQ